MDTQMLPVVYIKRIGCVLYIYFIHVITIIFLRTFFYIFWILRLLVAYNESPNNYYVIIMICFFFKYIGSEFLII